MNNLLVKLLNLPPALRKLAAVFIASIALVLLTGISMLGLSYVNNAEKSVVEARQKLGNGYATIRQLGAVDFSQSKELAQKVFLGNGDEGVLLAALQGKLTQLASSQNMAVNSIGSANSFSKDNIQYVGINIVFTGSVAQLHNTLLAIESASPTLFVRTARISSLETPPGLVKDSETKITAHLTIYGAIDPINDEGT